MWQTLPRISFEKVVQSRDITPLPRQLFYPEYNKPEFRGPKVATHTATNPFHPLAKWNPPSYTVAYRTFPKI